MPAAAARLSQSLRSSRGSWRDYEAGDAFGAGLDGKCPALPEPWDDERRVSACEAVCARAHTVFMW